jgi:hypothetical protein
MEGGMPPPVQLRRDDFVAQITAQSLDVNTLSNDSRMLNVDVGAADLDGNGAISGASEAGALFDAVDRLDRDGSALTMMLGQDGRARATAAPIAAIGDLANAPGLQLRANEALPGISQGAGRPRTTGVMGQGPGPFTAGGPFGPPNPHQVARQLQVQTIRNRVGQELMQDPPDFNRVFSEMGKLSKGEAASFARDLRLNHPELYQKLGSASANDPDTRATILSDEPALTRGIIQGQAKSLGRTALHGMPSEAIAELTRVPPADRAEVLRELAATDRTGLRALAQVCRDTQDPVLIDAFRRAGVRP